MSKKTVFPFCGVSLETCQYIAQECDVSPEAVYASFTFLHTDARYTTVAAMMKGLDPACGLCCAESCRLVIFDTIEKIVEKLKDIWLTPRQEWLDHPENLKYGTVLKDDEYAECQIIGSGDTNPIKCVSTVVGAYQPKYEDSVTKPFSLATHTGLFFFVSKLLYTGSTSDHIILQNELKRDPGLRALLLKYGILLDGGFHPTLIEKEGGEDVLPPVTSFQPVIVIVEVVAVDV